MTVATIMGKMQVFDNELDTAVGGADETRCITALDMAQDAFEAILANQPDTLGTISTITTTANQEYTTWPTSLLRLDTLWMMNTQVTPNVPAWEVRIIQDVGGQSYAAPVPWLSGIIGYTPQGFGAPTQAYTNRQYLFWSPIPDQVYTLRAYGLVAKTDLTTRTQTFEYPDQVATPMAAVAVEYLKIGIDDPSDTVEKLATRLYAPVIGMLRKPTRQRPQSRQYSRIHTT